MYKDYTIAMFGTATEESSLTKPQPLHVLIEEGNELATFGAGCFWGVEEFFRKVQGVKRTQVGYSGGEVVDPTYEQVCTGNSGHTEAIQMEFDPREVSFSQLLDIFWANHNPTTRDQQGPDIGSQYRSAIFFHNPSQKETAELSKARLQESGVWGTRTIVTSIEQYTNFYPAEGYHQRYFEKRGGGTCHF